MSVPFTGSLVVPGSIAAVFLLVLSHLQRQIRDRKFHLWQTAWGALVLYFFLTGIYEIYSQWAFLAAARCMAVALAVSMLISSRILHHHARSGMSVFEWSTLVAGFAWAVVGVGPFPIADPLFNIHPEAVMALVFVVVGWRFLRLGTLRGSLGFRMVSLSLFVWSALMSTRQFHALGEPFLDFTGAMAAIPESLLGLSMVMVMSENERRIVQEGALALSRLDIVPDHLLNRDEVRKAVQKLAVRIMPAAKATRVVLCVSERFRGELPSVHCGFDPEFIQHLQSTEITEAIASVTYRRGGAATFRSVADLEKLVPNQTDESLADLKRILSSRDVHAFTAVSLEGHERQLGFLLFPHAPSVTYGSAQLRVLLAQAMQISTTLDNYVLMLESQRRTREFEVLTQVGQVISSRLDPDEVLRTIHKELAHLFEADVFYVAFQNGDDIHFEFEAWGDNIVPKRSRKIVNGLTEYIIREEKPLLIRSHIEEVRASLGLTFPGHGAKSFIGVPVKMSGRTAGAMCVFTREREYVYTERDLEILQTAAGQLSVAFENALLYSEANRRAQYLSFLNNIANIAISNHGSDEMLAHIVKEIQKNFDFDHIGIGVLDYTTKDIEIRAEAGTTAEMFGRRIPVGVGILGRAARSQETVVVQNTGERQLFGIVAESRSVMCVPLKYGDTMLGLLNVESLKENAFPAQDVLLLNTLGDLLATALHNALIYQKMQQQSITDGLTGIKTRRFFLESLQSEWKRSSRSGRAFSVVLVDLDKFKEVNDTLGHLEGDLVLARVGRLLEQKCRHSNVVARYGGDEFVILMPETSLEQATSLSERLRVWMCADPMLSDRGVTGSFGVASFPEHGGTVDDIIRVADSSMYLSKHAGGNRVSSAEPVKADENVSLHRRQMLAFIESFLHRDHVSPADVDELVSNLRRLTDPFEGDVSRSLLQEAVRSLNHATEDRDPRAGSHGEQVSLFSEIIARRAGMPQEDIEKLVFAARVHDVGKILLPPRLVGKSGLLSVEDFNVLATHPELGAAILELSPEWQDVRTWVRHHHESYDGSGYPDQLREQDIPLGSRILAISDAYVNLTSEGPYSAAMRPTDALVEMERGNGTHYDPELLAILAEHVRGVRPAQAGA